MSVLALAVIAALVWGVRWMGHRGDDAAPNPTTTGAPRPTEGGDTAAGRPGDVPDIRPVTCPEATVRVNDAAGLRRALSQARAGDVIGLTDGTYAGRFVAKAKGTADRPIWLCGGSGAVIDGGDTGAGYALHLDGVSHWRVVGLTVRQAQKGVMLDGADHVTLQGLTVSDIGDEGVHLRKHSSDNVVADCTVSRTGLRKAQFGEGIYVGSAQSNWGELTQGGPDRSDRNVLVGNRISDTTAESIDIKEGTAGGFVLRNTLDGAGSHSAKTVVNVKGNAWRLTANEVTSPPGDAFQTHRILDGWGTRNLFEDNRATGSGDGYVVALDKVGDNVVTCSNRAEGGMKVSKTGCR